jgi:hypothetical protein
VERLARRPTSNITVAQTYRRLLSLPESPDQGIGLNVFSHLSAATKLWADVSIKMITEVMLAIMQKDLQEQSGTDARDPFVSQRGRLKGENNSQLGSVLPASAR